MNELAKKLGLAFLWVAGTAGASTAIWQTNQYFKDQDAQQDQHFLIVDFVQNGRDSCTPIDGFDPQSFEARKHAYSVVEEAIENQSIMELQDFTNMFSPLHKLKATGLRFCYRDDVPENYSSYLHPESRTIVLSSEASEEQNSRDAQTYLEVLAVTETAGWQFLATTTNGQLEKVQTPESFPVPAVEDRGPKFEKMGWSFSF